MWFQSKKRVDVRLASEERPMSQLKRMRQAVHSLATWGRVNVIPWMRSTYNRGVDLLYSVYGFKYSSYSRTPSRT